MDTSAPILEIADKRERVDVYLSSVTEFSRSRIQQLISQGCATVNDQAVKPSYMLKPGDMIGFTAPEIVDTDVAPQDIPLDILYEDEDLLVVNKPQGMVVHPAPGHADGTLVNALLFHVNDLSGIGGEKRPGIVHRLDRMTSGLLVVAKNDGAHRSLSEQFAVHSAARSYLSVVDGNFREDDGTVDAPIGRHPTQRKRMAVVPGGRSAVTDWKVLERYGSNTLLRLSLKTGRTHQIRVHMAYIKHPVTGDDVYGAKKNPFGLRGQALHGYKLEFTHPVTGERQVFFAPPPEYFLAVLHQLNAVYNLGKLYTKGD